MVIKDIRKIKSITSKYPDITSKKAEKRMEKLFYDMQKREDKLSRMRTEAILLEQELKEVQKEYRNKLELFDIEYADKEFKEIREEISLGIKNSSDYRNPNIG